MKRPTLLTQVLAVNALLITATVFAASVAASLHSDPVIERKRFLVLVAALMAMVLVNGWLLRRRFAPLEELIDAMERVDFGGRDPRAGDPDGRTSRRSRACTAPSTACSSASRPSAPARPTAVLQAQEGERARLARDLHDEANQALTGVLLRLEATAQDAPPELRAELRETQGVATQAMDELLRLARELRPVALDDLGLGAALRTQVDEFGRRAGARDAPEHPGRAASRTSTPTSRSSSTASSRRGCRTSPATPARAQRARRGRAPVGRRRVVRLADDGTRLHAERRRARPRAQGHARARRARRRALLRRLRAPRARHDRSSCDSGAAA